MAHASKSSIQSKKECPSAFLIFFWVNNLFEKKTFKKTSWQNYSAILLFWLDLIQINMLEQEKMSRKKPSFSSRKQN